DFDGDGYTNLEEYLNEVAEWPAPGPVVFNGATNNRYAQITNWDDNPDSTLTQPWQPSRFDTVYVKSGTAVVDAVGQHAKALIVGPQAGDVGTLNVTAGWIQIETTLGLSNGGSGQVNQSGGLVMAHLVFIGGPSGSPAIYNLSGGTLRTNILTRWDD